MTFKTLNEIQREISQREISAKEIPMKESPDEVGQLDRSATMEGTISRRLLSIVYWPSNNSMPRRVVCSVCATEKSQKRQKQLAKAGRGALFKFAKFSKNLGQVRRAVEGLESSKSVKGAKGWGDLWGARWGASLQSLLKISENFGRVMRARVGF